MCPLLYMCIIVFTGVRSKLKHGDPSSLGAGWATHPVQTQLSNCHATPGQRSSGLWEAMTLLRCQLSLQRPTFKMKKLRFDKLFHDVLLCRLAVFMDLWWPPLLACCHQPIAMTPQQIASLRQQQQHSGSGPPPLLLAPRASVPNVQVQGQRIIQQGLIRVASVANSNIMVNIPQVRTQYTTKFILLLGKKFS